MGKRFFKAGEKVVAYRQVKDGYMNLKSYPVGVTFIVKGYATFFGDKGEVVYVTEANGGGFFIPQSALKRV